MEHAAAPKQAPLPPPLNPLEELHPLLQKLVADGLRKLACSGGGWVGGCVVGKQGRRGTRKEGGSEKGQTVLEQRSAGSRHACVATVDAAGCPLPELAGRSVPWAGGAHPG
jgi:hypothetical protein